MYFAQCCHRYHKEAYVEEKCETYTSQGAAPVSAFVSKPYDANCIDSKMINLSFFKSQWKNV